MILTSFYVTVLNIYQIHPFVLAIFVPTHMYTYTHIMDTHTHVHVHIQIAVFAMVEVHVHVYLMTWASAICQLPS